MRKLIILIILALSALGIAYKLGYLDKMIVRYIVKEQLSKSNISKSPANEVITVQNATIQTIPDDNTAAVLTLKLQNNSNKTHELASIKTEISNDVRFFEAFHKEGKSTLLEVYGMPIEAFSIVTFISGTRFAKVKNITSPLKAGDSINIKLIFSDNSEKSVLATVK